MRAGLGVLSVLMLRSESEREETQNYTEERKNFVSLSQLFQLDINVIKVTFKQSRKITESMINETSSNMRQISNSTVKQL